METPIRSGNVALPQGRHATIWQCRAPLPAVEGRIVAWFLEGAFGAEEKPDLFVTPTAKGLFEETARNDFAWAEVDGEVISTAWTATPADEPRLGTMGEVYTDPAWRGNGLAPAVCGALLDRFDAAGGQVIYLGTSNPSAARIYAGLGYVPWPRGLMRRDAGAPEAFDAAWFGRADVSVRPMTWGDTPRLVALYSAPNPWLSACWMQGLYSASFVTHNRCNSLMKGTWQATRAGAWLGLVSGRGALVGSGPMEPRGNETAARGADMDLFVHPNFQADAVTLLAAMVAEARVRSWRWLRAELGDDDAAKAQLLTEAGFRDVARFERGLDIAGVSQDVRVLRLDV